MGDLQYADILIDFGAGSGLALYVKAQGADLRTQLHARSCSGRAGGEKLTWRPSGELRARFGTVP